MTCRERRCAHGVVCITVCSARRTSELDQGSQLVVHLDADLADVPGILATAVLEVLDRELL